MEKKIIIVGAGLAGSLCALYMLQRGYAVSVYERRSDMRKSVMTAGRSINLALSERGWTALKKVGIEARKDLEIFFDKKVFLDLYVKVNKNWRTNDRQLKRFGYKDS
jgi:2-polyprenyl-6-methoxyphenol hydroxylase-like FAD-dependent oxidoreductase